MLAHVPSFGRNPRGSPDFLAYPVPKACMHVLGTRVPRRLGVARSASSPKAAQALGCSLTPGLRISFGRVTCMARAASVPGLWALGFLLLACVCGWVRVAVGRGFCLPLPVVAGVLGGCVWARFVVLSLFCRLFVVFVVGPWCRPAFGTCVVSCAFPLPPPFPVPVCGVGLRAGPGSRLCPALLGLVVGLCFLRFFFFFFLPLLGVLVPGLVVSPPVSFLSGWAACFFFFFFFFCLFWCPFSRWAAVPGLVLPVLAGWSPCACLGVLSSVPSGWGVWPPCVFLAGGLVAVGCFAQPPPPPLFFFFFLGGGGGAAWLFLPLPSLGWHLLCGWCVVWLVPRHSWRRFLCATPRHSWLGFAAAGGGRSPPLLAGVLRRWCVVCGVWRWCVGGVVAGVWCGWSLATPGGGSCVLLPATPGWVSLPLVVGGPRHSWLGSACGGACVVWCVAVVCWWGCGWCVVWLVPRHSWRRFLCATPRHSWLGFAAAGGGRSPPLLAGVRLRRWCVVCGGGVLVGLWLVCGVVGPSPLLAEVPVCYSPPLLAGFRCRWWWAVPATPGWGPLAASVCGVWRWCVVGVVAGVWCGWSLATPGGGPCVLLPATPGRVSLPLVVGGPRHSWLGTVGGGGVWCVVCCWGPSPLLAEVPVCYSPPLLAGFRCRWWWAVPATPGWGPLAAVVCVLCLAGLGRFVFLLCLAPSGLGLPLSLSLLLPFLVGWGLWCVGWLLPGTCSCAVVRCVLCVLSGFVAPGGRRCLAPVRVPWLWPAAFLSGVPRGPAWCAAPCPVRSLSVLRSAFPTPWCLSPPRELAPPALLGGCAGHAEADREPGSLCLPLAPAEAGALGSLRVVPVRGPAMGLSLAGPSGVGLGLRALRWLACGPGH